MNAALRQARGEVIIRVDGHCEIAPSYVRRCVELLDSGEIQGVGGPIQTCGETYLARGIAAAMSHPFGVGDLAFRIEDNPHRLADSVPFPAYSREIIQKAGPYDVELVRNQDDEYNYRLRKLGAKILLSGEVRSRYYSRGNLLSLWRQYFWYGFWKVRVLQQHPMQMRPRQFVPPFFITFLVSFLVITLWHPPVWNVLMVLLGVYTSLVLVVSIVVGMRDELSLIPVVPLAFVILHFSYGFRIPLGAGLFCQPLARPSSAHVVARHISAMIWYDNDDPYNSYCEE